MTFTVKTIVKAALIACAVCQAVFALNAPYLISATALSDSSVSLSWRNNDAGSTGYLIQRKDSTETTYQFIDSVKTATQLTYTDLKSLRPSTLYTYQVIAYDATVLSDTSNSLQVTTLALTEIFKAPKISISGWNGDASTSIQISIIDSSNCEIGYRIYREQDFSSSYSVIADTVSSVPKNMGVTIIWTDNTVSFITWYRYKVAAYKSNDSLFSAPCTTFTFHYTPQPQNIVKFQKLSDYPVSVDSTGWSARAGDSIIIKENPSPAGMFSVINASNPASPVFAGYIDSTAARAYSLQTLIPVFLNYGVSNSYTSTKVVNYSDRMLIAKDSIIRMYQVDTSNLLFIDSTVISGSTALNLLSSGDTALGIRYCRYGNIEYIYAVCLSPAGFSQPSFVYSQTAYFNTGGITVSTTRYFRPYIHGSAGNSMYVSYDYYQDYRVSSVHTYTYTNYCITANIPNRVRYTSTVNMPYAGAFNTGRYLSLTENLSTNCFPFSTGGATHSFMPGDVPTELFASSILDPRPHETDSLNNAIYIDTVHRQNTLQNILLDTANKRVFLIFTNNMSILSYYDSVMTAITSHAGKLPSSRGLVILPGPVSSSVTIVLPAHMRSADLYFYDISGRVIDKMSGMTSSAVLWKPKTRTMSCYIVMVKSGQEKFTAKFMVR